MLIHPLDALAYARGLQSQGLQPQKVARMTLDRFVEKYAAITRFGPAKLRFDLAKAVLYFDGTEWRLDRMSAPMP
jgi:hypothetical protein